MDTFEGKLGEPRSLHKYNYCYVDPVNGSDPSGYNPEDMNMGNGVHQFLYAEFQIEALLWGYDPTFLDETVDVITFETFGRRALVNGDLSRPDIVGVGFGLYGNQDTTRFGEVYEIKPVNIWVPGVRETELRMISNDPQLSGYISALQANVPADHPFAWTKGFNWSAGWREWPYYSGAKPGGTMLVTYANYSIAPGALGYNFVEPINNKAREYSYAYGRKKNNVTVMDELAIAANGSQTFSSSFYVSSSQIIQGATILAMATISALIVERALIARGAF